MNLIHLTQIEMKHSMHYLEENLVSVKLMEIIQVTPTMVKTDGIKNLITLRSMEYIQVTIHTTYITMPLSYLIKTLQ
jgi:hypothetical protein